MTKYVRIVIICLIAFIVISVGVTYYLINKYKQSNLLPNEEVQTEEKGIKGDEGIDLYGTYDENSLIVNEVVVKFNGTDITIPQIEGLKDKIIQEKINEDMKQKIFSKIENVNVIEDSYVNINSNFGNVLSLQVYLSAIDWKDSVTVQLNYNLVTGEKLKFEEIFTSTADIVALVREGFYIEEARVAMYADQLNYEYGNTVSPDEESLYKKVKSFLQIKDHEFYLLGTSVSLIIDEAYCTIEFVEHPKDIAIYTKFLTDESIYEDDTIGQKRLITCTNSQALGLVDKQEYGKTRENLWYHISSMSTYYEGNDNKEIETRTEAFKNEKYDELKKNLEKYEKIAKENPDKFYIVIHMIDASTYRHSEYNYDTQERTSSFLDLITIGEYTTTYVMPIEKYETIYKDLIIDGYRYEYYGMRGVPYIDDYNVDQSDVELTITETTKLYNAKTKQELKTLEEVFAEDSNYIDRIKQEAITKLGYDGWHVVDAQALLETAIYSIDGDNIKVSIPEINKDIEIYYMSFEPEFFKVSKQ